MNKSMVSSSSDSWLKTYISISIIIWQISRMSGIKAALLLYYHHKQQRQQSRYNIWGQHEASTRSTRRVSVDATGCSGRVAFHWRSTSPSVIRLIRQPAVAARL